MPPKKLLERDHAKFFVQWYMTNSICREYMLAIPNGGKRNAWEARNMKLEGVRAGVSDYFLAYPSKGKAGLWIELKSPDKGILSKNQKEWIDKMNSVGYMAEVGYGWKECADLVISYLKNNLN